MKNTNQPPRPPTLYERTLIDALIDGVSEDKSALRQQIETALVALVSEGDRFHISIFPDRNAAPPYRGERRLPATATARDDEGGPLLVDLFAEDGYLTECEVTRADGGVLVGRPDPSRMRFYDTSGDPEGSVRHLEMP